MRGEITCLEGFSDALFVGSALVAATHPAQLIKRLIWSPGEEDFP
jgi:hypothetical protein